MPAHVIKALLQDAAKKSGIKQPGKRSTYADLVPSTIFMQESMFLDQEFKDVVKHEGFVGMNGTKRVRRVWPKLQNWSGVLSLVIADSDKFEPAVLEELLVYAGLWCGACDYRPEFGRFNIEKI